MGQNRSTAVMQHRTEAMDSLEDFPTAPWATRALLEFLTLQGFDLGAMRAWEPACNLGYMAKPMAEYFKSVYATDICDYGWEGQDAVADFLIDWDGASPEVDMIITNPPFRLASAFILRALEIAPYVAVFVRSAFDEGGERYFELFSNQPELYALPFTERVVLWKGVLLDPDVKIWHPKKNKDGTLSKTEGVMKKPSSATAYQWLVFQRGHTGFSLKSRIGPCRKALTRDGDYPDIPAHLRRPEGLLI